LEANKAQNEARINKTKQEKEAFEGLGADEEDQKLEKATEDKIIEKTRQLFKIARGMKQDEKLEMNYTTLTMLTEIESILNKHFEEFREFEKEDSERYSKLKKQIRKDD